MDDELEFSVFISHGRSSAWKDVARFIEVSLDVPTMELSESPNRGRTIIQKLDEETNNCSFAVIVITAEDEMASGDIRARQNVVHEIGFFQGRVGLQNVLFLMEEGVQGFSNIDGIVYESFKKNHIKSTFERIRQEIEHAIDELEDDDEYA